MNEYPEDVSGEQAKDLDACRTFTLETLNVLYVEFQKMGKLSEAGPLIERLMGIAYGDLPPQLAAFIETRNRNKRNGG